MPVGGALAIAGAGLASGAMSASAQKKAGQTVANSTDRAAELQNQQFQQMLALQMPGYNRAEQAAGVYGAALGLPRMTSGQSLPTGQSGGTVSYGGAGGMMTGGPDWAGYRRDNPDVQAAIDNGYFGGEGGADGAAQRHYEEYGRTSGHIAPVTPSPQQQITPQQQISQQVMQTPGYQAQLEAGITAIDRAAPLTGGMYSGRRLKALESHGQQTFGGYYQDWINRVGGMAGQAQTISQNIGQAGMQNAQNVGGLMVQGANARANGQVNSANAWNGAIGDAVGAGMMIGGQAGWFKK